MAKPIYLQLDDLYREEWGKIAKDLEPFKDVVSIPFMPTTQKSGDSEDETWWTDAPLRIMVFGRETGKSYPNTPLAEVLKSPDGVVAEADAQFITFMSEMGNPRGLLSVFNYFRKQLPQAAFLWNNLDLVAVANEDGSLSAKNREAYDVQARFSTAVLPKMVEIINPNVVVFLTSSSRDAIITRNFGVADFEAFDDVHGADELAWVKNFPVAKVAYRANHPASRTNTLKNEVKDSIIADIKENFKL